MYSERSRLRTFQNWPTNAPVDYERIAKAGFYYMGQNLEVQCFSCGGRISEWQYGDMVMAKHRLLDPRCPFVVNPVESGNVPITETTSESMVGGTSTSRVPYDGQADRHSDDVFKYKNEAARIESFITWPIPTKVEGYRLAKAGFYYLQELDKVRCAFCGIDAYKWEAGDDPIVEHRRHSPTCPFLSNLSFGCSSRNSDEVITLRDQYFHFEPELGLDADRMKEFGILNHRIPKHSKYITEESRILSFEKWPKGEIKDPVELAVAGFYYTGVDDKVRCYHCGGGLQKWKANDDPWVEHAKWFPSCDFLYLVKGEEFIDEVKKNMLTSFELEQQQSSNSSTNRNPSYQTIDDSTWQCLMTSAPILSTLDLGLDVSRIKRVLRDQLQRQKKTSLSKDELIAAVLDAQFNEPVADPWSESKLSSSAFVDFPRNSEVLREVRQLRRTSSSSGLVASNSTNQTHQESDVEHLDLNMADEDDEVNLLRGLSNTSTLAEDLTDTDQNSELEIETVNNIDSTNRKRAVWDISAVETEDVTKCTQTLEEENRKLKEAKLCKICMDQDVNIVFLPCGHLVTCSNCAANIPDCPVCRQMIKGTVRTFLA